MTIGLTGAVDTTAPPVTTPPPTIALSLGTPRPGSSIGVSGNGFVGGEQVQVAVLSTPRNLTTLTAAADGSVGGFVSLPSDLEAGSHQIRLLGLSSNRVVLSNPFTVSAGTSVLARTGDNFGPLTLLGGALLAAGLLLITAARARASAVSLRRYRSGGWRTR